VNGPFESLHEDRSKWFDQNTITKKRKAIRKLLDKLHAAQDKDAAKQDPASDAKKLRSDWVGKEYRCFTFPPSL